MIQNTFLLPCSFQLYHVPQWCKEVGDGSYGQFIPCGLSHYSGRGVAPLLHCGVPPREEALHELLQLSSTLTSSSP